MQRTGWVPQLSPFEKETSRAGGGGACGIPCSTIVASEDPAVVVA